MMASETRTQNAVRWGLLSTARVNRHIVAAMKVIDEDGVITSVASRNLAAAEEYAKTNGIATAYGTYDELLASPEVDVVYVSLPNHLHVEWVLKALKSGKHVLCEKPATLQVGEFEQLFAQSRESGRHLVEGYMHLHTNLFAKVKELLANDALGQLIHVNGVFGYEIGNREGHRRLSFAEGGGSLWDVGCYPISFLTALLGEPQVLSSTASEVAASVGGDAITGLLRFPSGVTGTLHSSFTGPLRNEITLTGTKGSLTLLNPFKPLGSTTIEINRNFGEIEKIVVEESYSHLYAAEIVYLNNLVRQDAKEGEHQQPQTNTFLESTGKATISVVHQLAALASKGAKL